MQSTLHTKSTAGSEGVKFRRAQWKMLLAVMFCYAFYYTGRQNLGWAAAALIQQVGLSPVQVGWINGGMLLFYGIGQAVHGNLGDAWGARLLMTAGAVCSCILNWAFSFAHSAGSMLALWSANGYVQSLGFAPGGRLVANWWAEHERGRAFGLYLLAAGSSSVITYALCIAVLGSFGWRYVFRLPVLGLLGTAIVFGVVARNSPEEAGFKSQFRAEEQADPGGWAARYAALAGNRRFLAGCVTIGFESTARYGLLTWTPLVYFGHDWKQNPSTLWVTLALPVGMALGAWTCGQVSDRIFGCRRSAPIALFLGLAAISSLALYLTPASNATAGTILLFFAGFFVFGPQSMLWALRPDLLGTRRTATSIGVMDACAYGFAAAGEPIYGLFIQSHSDPAIAFLLTAAASAMGCLSILAVRR